MALIETHPTGIQGPAPSARAAEAARRREFRPEPCDQAISLRVISEADTAEWDRAERFVYRIYRDAGFCGESSRQWVEESEPYRAGSRLHVVVHPEDDEIVGVIRTFVGTYESLPIGQFPATIPVPDDTLIEIGSLAVSSSMRGLGVANELHRSAVQESLRQGVPAFCMLVEPWSIDFYRDVYGLPLVETAPAREYMGSLTVPAIADLAELVRILVDEMPALYQWMVEGLEPELWSRGNLPILLP